MSERNKVKLTICGNDFLISTDDSEEYMQEISRQVDGHIRRLMNFSGSMSTSMAAMFAALEFCDQATKAKEAADNLREQLKSYLEDATLAKSEAAELRRREQTLTRENHELRARLERGRHTT
jgi:cell division protein ZapA